MKSFLNRIKTMFETAWTSTKQFFGKCWKGLTDFYHSRQVDEAEVKKSLAIYLKMPKVKVPLPEFKL